MDRAEDLDDGTRAYFIERATRRGAVAEPTWVCYQHALERQRNAFERWYHLIGGVMLNFPN